MKKIIIPLLVLVLALVSCHHPCLPVQYTDSPQLPEIYPDYTGGITIPRNLAPLTFELKEQADDAITRISCGQCMCH